MAASGGIILNSLNVIHRIGVCSGVFPGVLSQVRHYAARKGTREKMKKKKVKVEVKKLTFAEKVRRSRNITITKPDAILYRDDSKPIATDDVFYGRYFRWKIYPFAEAVECHRENFHPTMYDLPNALLKIFVELNMTGVKKTKPLDSFHNIVPIKNSFDHGEDRKILAFCKTEDQVKEALDEGAALAGGSDIIKLILDGEISLHNYDIVVAHPNIMPEVLTLRGLLKKKHPNIKAGTLGNHIKHMVYTQLRGIKYQAKPYDHFPEYGHTTVPIGKLDMDVKKLEENLQNVIDSIMSAKPKRPGSFITRIRLDCPPSIERFKLDLSSYIKEEEEEPTVKKEGDESDEEEAAEAIAN